MHPARIWTEHSTSKAAQNETTLCASLELSHKTRLLTVLALVRTVDPPSLQAEGSAWFRA
jgi:hypothetical protein